MHSLIFSWRHYIKRLSRYSKDAGSTDDTTSGPCCQREFFQSDELYCNVAAEEQRLAYKLIDE